MRESVIFVGNIIIRFLSVGKFVYYFLIVVRVDGSYGFRKIPYGVLGKKRIISLSFRKKHLIFPVFDKVFVNVVAHRFFRVDNDLNVAVNLFIFRFYTVKPFVTVTSVVGVNIQLLFRGIDAFGLFRVISASAACRKRQSEYGG